MRWEYDVNILRNCKKNISDQNDMIFWTRYQNLLCIKGYQRSCVCTPIIYSCCQMIFRCESKMVFLLDIHLDFQKPSYINQFLCFSLISLSHARAGLLLTLDPFDVYWLKMLYTFPVEWCDPLSHILHGCFICNGTIGKFHRLQWNNPEWYVWKRST